MNRQEKVIEFFRATRYRPHWCTGDVCACMGCVNRHRKEKETRWHVMFPNEQYLTKDDVDEYNRQKEK